MFLIYVGRADTRSPRADEDTRARVSPVFTPAHRSVLDAVRDFFNRRPVPVQPLAFTHKVHLANGMHCTDCHTAVEAAPVAGIPGVELCMTCHQMIAADKPEIKKLAAYQKRGEDIPWQRVYAFSPTVHVKFNHAPHIRAGVECKTCHGDMTQQTVAVRAVDLNMGYCVNCHRQKQASTDCITCHY
ncbi:MAG: cytochrome c family protein [Acidobacteriia bacterium]|nr:cytochrome c family protein [Terriglobia bacterium]